MDPLELSASNHHIHGLCGPRLNEALSVRREWLDLERGYLTLPPKITKTGRPREIPIPSELKQELKRHLEKHSYEKGYLFCVQSNPEKMMPAARFREEYIELLKRLRLDARTTDGSAYVLHSHFFKKWYHTILEFSGVNKLLIDLWMNHNSGIEKHYYLLLLEIVKQEFEKTDHALRIFGATPQVLIEDRLKALDDAIEFYEALMDHIARKNPRLLLEILVLNKQQIEKIDNI